MKELSPARKLTMAALALSLIVVSHNLKQIALDRYQIASPQKCLVDPLRQNLSGTINFFSEHINLAKFVIALNSLIVDAFQFFFLYFFVYKGLVTVIAIGMPFYAARILCVNLAGQWPLPDPFIFSDPGVPSVFVSYMKACDLYFSGHVGNMTMTTILCYYYGFNSLGVIGHCMIVFTFLTMLISGAHLTNDLIIGAVAGTLFFSIGIKARFLLSLGIIKMHCAITRLLLGNDDNVKGECDDHSLTNIICGDKSTTSED